MTENVALSVRNTTGVIELTRPRALNSLSPDMVTAIKAQLEQWREDPAITHVVVTAAERGFCAGGDVRGARQEILDGHEDEVDAFFAEEYALNLLIAEYPKPYIALIDGVLMGGGMGISIHGSHRVMSPNTIAAMPEAAIGYVTDVGMSHTLQHLPSGKAIGRFISLTGYRLNIADLVYTGLATHVGTVELADVVERGVAALEGLPRETVGNSPLERFREQIDKTFGFDTWEEISAALEASNDVDFVEFTRELLASASPSALVAITELLAANYSVSLEQALENERVLGERMRREPDFIEGVRAVLVDKDRSPHFGPVGDANAYRALLRSARPDQE
ncbi:3-hydroxyisobutyryl-CoA hydrolase [Corynebacterium tapiri]|uniref:3-hydroxyisobutyryl-CoA hydrolase n=1 Tax=Corynebacterium tapiri TaxID=1448266 RepID=A0A5C4U6C5_9CORY|nr:3-hydroxyisobutyryl-CoA hydrolase [Corynebacterium tapiri]TNM00452.1 enoyl-CoA hydratase/isomerase family protein [Corynebacterium tapiri]